jgi:flavodoxin
MKAITLYDTRFGNTERIAKSLETGLKQVDGIQSVVCINAKDVPIDSLKEYDLICIGAPTEGFTASKSIKKFLGKLKGIDLVDKYGFAFDTKLDSRLSGSAAKYIEKELSSKGFIIIAPRESAIVFAEKESGTIAGARLKEGEEERFRKIGTQLGRGLAAKARVVQS